MISLILSTLAVSTPAVDDTFVVEDGFGAGWLADLGGFALLALLIIVVIAVVIKLQKGVEAMQGQAADAEARFAEELAKIAKASAGKREEPRATPLPTATPDAEQAPPPTPEAVAPQATPAQRPSSPSAVMRNPMALQKVESLQELANNLYGLRIITDLEGRVPLPLPPEGLIYRLRRGGACLLLPRLENADTMEHFCKRFDLVFIITTSGEVLVMERKQSRIVDLTERSSSGLPKF